MPLQPIRYRHVAWVYDTIASAYSFGAIDRAKAVHVGQIKPGDKLLYAGAGTGREIVGALERGAEVTCIEPCPAMASRLHRRLSSAADGFTIVPKPVQAIPAEPAYNLVIAHFFLNVFDAATMPEVLAHLCRLVKPGGHIVIADFKPSADNAGMIDHLARSLHYRPVNLVGRLLRICALHPIYNYEPLLESNGFQVVSRKRLGATALYETMIAKKQPSPNDEG